MRSVNMKQTLFAHNYTTHQKKSTKHLLLLPKWDPTQQPWPTSADSEPQFR